MTRTLDYAPPAAGSPSRVLAILAHVATAYPLFLLGSLYGEWFLAWHALGHQPRCSIDDPKFISGSSWMHPITGIALMSMMPAACAALFLNTLYIINHQLRGRRLALQVALLLLLWLGMIALLRWDPHPILEWWMD